MPSRSRNNATSKQDMVTQSKKVYACKKKSLSSLLAHKPKLQRDLSDKNHTYSLDDATSTVYSQEPKMTSSMTDCGNDAKDKEFFLEESHFDYII
jgi:hypothetical protein